MTRNATSSSGSIQRSAGSNSSASNASGDPASWSTLPRWRSPWHSRTLPLSRRSAQCGASRARSSSSQARSAGQSLASSPRPRSQASIAAIERRATSACAAADPNCESAGATGASRWIAANRRANASMSAPASEPAAIRSLQSAPSGKRRMRTATSTTGPSPSNDGPSGPARIATTSRYRSGAKRRLMRSSSPQSRCRSARLVKSRNGRRTGFLILCASSRPRRTHEIAVSTSRGGDPSSRAIAAASAATRARAVASVDRSAAVMPPSCRGPGAIA